MTTTTAKTAIVTGAGKGIGRELTLRLATMGYTNLALAARTSSEIDAVALQCHQLGAKTIAIPTDITQEEQVNHLFQTTLQTFGSLDLLVNNAGMGIFNPIHQTTLDEWNQVIATNLTGSFLCARQAFAHMKDHGGGTILNVSSVVGIKGYPRQGAYTASKHGMVGLTKVLAEEGREYNIRAHVICPGGVATEMVRQSRPDLNPDEIIQPQDVADLMQYLLEMPPRISIDLVHLRRFNSASF